MRKPFAASLLTLLLICLAAPAQTVTFSSAEAGFVLEFPSSAWKPMPRVDVHDHVDFIYRDGENRGYLHLRQNLVDAGTTAADLFRRDEKQELRFLPGYVVCGDCQGESVAGYLPGVAYAYEYTSGGRQMAGRIYYLQADNRSFYSLRFTGERDQLASLRDQMASIARSFRIK